MVSFKHHADAMTWYDCHVWPWLVDYANVVRTLSKQLSLICTQMVVRNFLEQKIWWKNSSETTWETFTTMDLFKKIKMTKNK